MLFVEARARRVCDFVVREPVVRDGVSFVKPDLLLVRGDTLFVVDVAVASDAFMCETAAAKREKYDTPRLNVAFVELVKSAGFDVTNVVHSPFVVGARGLLDSSDADTMRLLSFSSRDVDDVVLLVVRGSVSTYHHYYRSMYCA